MQHIIAAGNGFVPTSVLFEIGGEERQIGARVRASFFQQVAYVAFPIEIADGGSDPVTGRK
jgi:hypothetical protein